MTSTAEGYTEDDGLAYEDNTAFGNDNGFRWLWTGRGLENQTPYTDTCADWTSNNGGDESSATATDITFYNEKLGTFTQTCDAPQPIICIVDPPGCHVQGAMKYNAGFNVMEYCNGTEWVSMGPIGGTPPTDGLVGYWALDETTGLVANDTSGSGINGTMLNGLDAENDSVSGMINGAISFDGTDDMINLGDNYDDISNLTVAAWVNAGGFNTLNGILGKEVGGASSSSFVLRAGDAALPSNQLQWVVVDSALTRYKLDSNVFMNTGEWYHVVATHDTTGRVALYVNGTLSVESAGVTNGTINNGTQDLIIGNNSLGGGRYWTGAIDDVRIYNRVLTLNEIQQLYYYGLSNGLGDVDNGCASPAAEEGEMIYNADFNVMQYCNGEQWVGLGQ